MNVQKLLHLILTMATAAPVPRNITNSFKREVSIKIEAALKTVYQEYFSRNCYIPKDTLDKLFDIMTLEPEQVSRCFVPQRQSRTVNHLSESHAFAHIPERRIQHDNLINFEVSANGGLTKIVKILSPLGGKVFGKFRRGRVETQTFPREPFPSGAELLYQEGFNHDVYQVTISIQADYQIAMCPRGFLLSRRCRNVVLAQEVLAKLPEFKCDERNNIASCVIKINLFSAGDSVTIRPQ